MTSGSPPVLTLGEVLVEIMRPDAETPLDEPGIFEGPFPSGAPAIFAVAAARFGLDTGFIGCTGQDAFSRLLLHKFRSEGVDTSASQVAPGGQSTGVAFVAYGKDGSREFVFHIRGSAAGFIRPEELAQTYFSRVRWLHISGSTLMLGSAWQQAVRQAISWTRVCGGSVSIDPNLRPDLMPDEEAAGILVPLLRTADLLFPTEAELLRLAPGTGSIESAAAQLAGPGALVVTKRGPDGCTVFGPNLRQDFAAYPVTEVDPTGAGDIFAAAFIAGIETGATIPQAARMANAAGAFAVTRRGPMEGIADWEMVKQMSSHG